MFTPVGKHGLAFEIWLPAERFSWRIWLKTEYFVDVSAAAPLNEGFCCGHNNHRYMLLGRLKGGRSVNIKLLGAMHLKTEPPGYHLIREHGQMPSTSCTSCPRDAGHRGQACQRGENACILKPGTRQEQYAQDRPFTNNFVTFKVISPTGSAGTTCL